MVRKASLERITKETNIKVNVEVSYGSTVTGTINFTPIVKGSFIDAYLYDKGNG